jgi:hypothetical protein
MWYMMMLKARQINWRLPVLSEDAEAALFADSFNWRLLAGSQGGLFEPLCEHHNILPTPKI